MLGHHDVANFVSACAKSDNMHLIQEIPLFEILRNGCIVLLRKVSAMHMVHHELNNAYERGGSSNTHTRRVARQSCAAVLIDASELA